MSNTMQFQASDGCVYSLNNDTGKVKKLHAAAKKEVSKLRLNERVVDNQRVKLPRANRFITDVCIMFFCYDGCTYHYDYELDDATMDEGCSDFVQAMPLEGMPQIIQNKIEQCRKILMED